MTKYICSISGYCYQIVSDSKERSAISGLFINNDIVHPIFTLSITELDKIYNSQFLRSPLTEHDLILLTIAYLNVANLLYFQNNEYLHWHDCTKNKAMIISCLPDCRELAHYCVNNEYCLKVGVKIDSHLFFDNSYIIIPRIAINSYSDHGLENLNDYIIATNELIAQRRNEIKQAAWYAKLKKQQAIVDNFIISETLTESHKQQRKLARIKELAKLIAIIAKFPPQKSLQWQELIYLSAIPSDNASAILRAKQATLINTQEQEFDTCIEYIFNALEYSNNHANAIMDILKTGKERYQEIFGTVNSDYYIQTVLNNKDNISTNKPNRLDYENTGEYIKALANWQEYQRLINSQQLSNSLSTVQTLKL